MLWFHCQLIDWRSVLGSALVITGLYFVLWGKSKEAQTQTQTQTQRAEVKPTECNEENKVQQQQIV